MTHRVAGAAVYGLMIVLLVLLLASCARRQAGPATSPVPARPAVSAALSPAGGATARPDPAVQVAVRFERAHCSWDWRRPLSTYTATQQALATPAYGTQLAAAADPVSWREEVVAGKQRVTCTVRAAHRVVGAPSTATRVYVRMSVDEQVTSTLGSFDTGPAIASWLVTRTAAGWLVAGPFEGG